MKCNASRWLWGLPLLAMWVCLTVLSERDQIQDDLTGRSHQALAAAGYDWAKPSFEGRDGTVTGWAVRDRDPAEATTIINRIWGVRVAEAKTGLIDKIENYLWSAVLQDKTVVLSGNVPDPSVRAELVALAKSKFPKYTIRDEMTLARGAPDAKVWRTAIAFGLSQLNLLESGRFELRNLGVILSGNARSHAGFKGLKQALRKQLPRKVSLISVDVAPPVVSSYLWQAKLSATQLVLSGYVPHERLRETLFAQAKQKFPKIAIVDRIELASGAPDGWEKTVHLTLDQLAALSSGSAKISDQYLTLRGTAPTKQAADRIRDELAGSIPADFRYGTDLTFPKSLPARVSPYTTTIRATTDEVVLTGYVPNEAGRAAVAEAAKKTFGNRTVRDQLELGSGQIPGWNACVLAGIRGLGRLSEGHVELVERRMVLSGRTADEKVSEALPAEVRAAANRSCDSEVQVTLDTLPEPNLTWRARRTAPDQLILGGEVPDAAARHELVELANSLYPDANVTDQTKVVPTQNASKWLIVAKSGLRLLAKLRSGDVELSNQVLRVSGVARDTAVEAAVNDFLAHTITKGYTGRGDISVRSDAMIWADQEAERQTELERERQKKIRLQADGATAADDQALEQQRLAAAAEARAVLEAAQRQRQQDAQDRLRNEADAERRRAEYASRVSAAEAEGLKKRQDEAGKCENLLRSAAAEGVIKFRFGSADLARRSHTTLDRLVKIANACPSFAIEIEGHTDSRGSPERNQSLSERRAESVVSYLAENGVARERLLAVGYGETRPVASNDTAANRAKNRRIEFAVKL